ncbi:SH3 domain-containing protein [Desulfoscipio gibsoniae]|uniref:N-acetylmuramoyl-L-alanine amidase n=1 Tax=Desulfoscipio gibsoniae DSM 7213 TaxID=767817 RepID=R4KEJ5_9FIRM|nr:SH3 domain-containing protein [Desulfoscipio gibsoniae]AGL01613.1 N-acetylmuramoyl-L-alanine amidase [Desulfoscipio gibsoniae DSM 7213]
MKKHWNWKQKIKKGFIISCLFTAGLILAPSAVSAATQLTVGGSTVNVRGGPDTNTAIVASVHKGEQFTALDQRGDWYKIKVGNAEGWIAGWLVQAKTVADTPTSYAVVKSNSINVRGGPGTSHTVVSQVNANTKLPVLELSGDWVKVQLPGGGAGWVAGWLVQIQKSGDQPTPAQQVPSAGQADQSSSQPGSQNNTVQVKQATITASTVNVRSGPGTSNGIVAKVNQGEKYTVTEVNGQWLKISLPGGKAGWIAAWLAGVSEVAINQPAAHTGDNNTGPPAQTQPSASSNTVATGGVKIKQATITATAVNVRSGPGTSNSTIAKVNQGEKYTVTEVNGQWLKISLPGGKAGWIAAWLAGVSEVAAAQPNAPSQGSSSGSGGTGNTGNGDNSDNTGINDTGNVQVVINDNDVNLRGGPGTQHNIVAQVSRGARLGVLERTGDWYKVSLEGGVIGWVAGWMVDIEQAEASPAPGDPPVETEDTDQSDKINPGTSLNLEKIEVKQENNHTLVSIKAAGELNYDMFLLTNPQRLVIDLKNTNIGDLPENVTVNTEAVAQMRTGLFGTDPPAVRVVLDLKKAVVSVDKLSSDRQQLDLDIYVPELGEFLQGRVIAIDPGHGGSDPGAIGPTGLQEKDVNLDISLKLAQLLNENGARVVLTRSDDRFVDLYERTAIAQREGAEVFLSIHSNANASRDKNGTSTYYRRDTGEFPPGIDQADNRRLAGAVQSELLRTLGRRSLGVLQSNFVVLRTSTVPAVLAEVAFISNPEEEQMLRQETVRAKVAEALALALNNYFAP